MSYEFRMNKVIVCVDSGGNLTLDLNGTTLFVKAYARHEFMNKIQKAVNMADVADPANEPMNKALT